MVLIVACIVSVIFVFIIGFSLLKMREAQRAAARNKSLNRQFRKIQIDFRALVLPLYTDNIADAITKQRLISITTNFFVFQPISETNLERLSTTVESCRSVFEQCRLANTQYPEKFPAVFAALIDAIPDSARYFNAQFYIIALPNILARFNQAIEELFEQQEIESTVEDTRNDETLGPEEKENIQKSEANTRLENYDIYENTLV